MSHPADEQGSQQIDPPRPDGAPPAGNGGTNESASRGRLPHWLPIVALAAIWAVVLAVLVAWGLAASASAKPDTADCKQAGPVPGVPSTQWH